MTTLVTETPKIENPSYISTTNACKLCRPLGACLAFRGIEGALPFLHGSQGCATYMRRYIISHFGEPVDIASSSLGEKQAVFGGGPNFKQGLINVIKKYQPLLIGVATTCLTETIGDDVPLLIKEFRNEFLGDSPGPILVNTSTPSYSGSHMEGFHSATRAVVEKLADTDTPTPQATRVNLMPGFLSPADVRYLKEIMDDFGIHATIVPDISETLDAPILLDYPRIPKGGTPIKSIMGMGSAAASIEFGWTINSRFSSALFLKKRFGVPAHIIGTPIGIRESDLFFQIMEQISGLQTPRRHVDERNRLIDALVDGHKYLFGKRAIVFGEEDLTIGITSFLVETGVKPVLCASGGNSGGLKRAIEDVCKPILSDLPIVKEDVDFWEISEMAKSLSPDLIIGHSKGYKLARELDVPLIRTGFPIHDRIGGQRILHIGYRGAQQLFDRIANALIEKKQRQSGIGYGYF